MLRWNLQRLMTNTESVRLQKLLASVGVGSRRTIEQMIVEGRIRVNGTIAVLGDRATLEDSIELDGTPLELRVEKVSYLLNKPRGVISTASDEHGRQSVIDLIDSPHRLYPVGRLDADTTGLIIVTSDGELTYRLTHPKHGVDKTYIAKVSGDVSESELTLLREGVELEDGMTAPARVKVVDRSRDASLVELSIHEGRNRQIRRMMDAVGHPVITLHRVSIGPVSDSGLRPGQYRELTILEIHALNECINGENHS